MNKKAALLANHSSSTVQKNTCKGPDKTGPWCSLSLESEASQDVGKLTVRSEHQTVSTVGWGLFQYDLKLNHMAADVIHVLAQNKKG